MAVRLLTDNKPSFILRTIETLNDVYETLKNLINSFNDFRKMVVEASNGNAAEITALYQRSSHFHDSAVDGTTYNLNVETYFHLVDAGGGATQVVMPDPTDANSVGRTVVIKRNNTGGNAVTVMDVERGNNVALTAQDYYLHLYCNGADWWMIAERR